MIWAIGFATGAFAHDRAACRVSTKGFNPLSQEGVMSCGKIWPGRMIVWKEAVLTEASENSIGRDIILRCKTCGREQAYARTIDATLPAEVVLIVSTACDRCDRGDRGTEVWFDANGREVSQDDCDTDRSPKGGNSEGGSVRSTRAGAEGIAQSQPTEIKDQS